MFCRSARSIDREGDVTGGSNCQLATVIQGKYYAAVRDLSIREIQIGDLDSVEVDIILSIAADDGVVALANTPEEGVGACAALYGVSNVSGAAPEGVLSLTTNDGLLGAVTCEYVVAGTIGEVKHIDAGIGRALPAIEPDLCVVGESGSNGDLVDCRTAAIEVDGLVIDEVVSLTLPFSTYLVSSN